MAATPEIVNGGDKTSVNDVTIVENGDSGFVDPGAVMPEISNSNSRLGPQQYHFGRPQFGGPLQADWFHWIKDGEAWSKNAKIRPLTETSESYRNYQEIYRNIHVSYLMLLLFPMVSLLSLVRSERQIVDVHV